jgi:hypothetical protein
MPYGNTPKRPPLKPKGKPKKGRLESMFGKKGY